MKNTWWFCEQHMPWEGLPFGFSWFVGCFRYSGSLVTSKLFFWLWSLVHCIVFAWILTLKTEQPVAIGESWSEPTNLQYGVPQGSILGPVLFTVYTGSLHLVFFWKLMELAITFLQVTLSCGPISGLKILMKTNIGIKAFISLVWLEKLDG